MTYKKLLLTGGTIAVLDFVFLKFLTPLFNKMVKGIRYLADKIEALQFWLIAKWNNFLKGLML